MKKDTKFYLFLTVAIVLLWGFAMDLTRPTPVHAQFASQIGFNYKEISTNASTVIKTASGMLHTITINNAGSAWTIQVFDNTTCSGNTIAGATAFTVPTAGNTLHYDLQTNAGLCILTAGTTPGDLTVTSR